jgi:MFS family permease
MLDRQILSLMVAPIKRDFGLSDFQIGLLQGFALSLLYSIASFPIGWMVDRYPRRPIIWIGVTLWSLFAAGCGLAQSFWQLFVARLGVGIGEASLAPAAYSMLADLFRRSRLAFAMSTMVLGSCIGNGVAIVLGGAIVTFAETARFHELPILGTVASWRYIFLLTGLPGLVIATMIFLVREPVRRKRTTAAHPPLIEVLRFIGSRRRFFTAHFIGFGLLSTMGWGFMSWLPTYMSRAFGWTIGQISLPLAVITGVGGAVGTLALGWLADHLFAKGRADAHMRIYVVVALGMTIAGVAAFQVHDPWLFLMLAAPVLATLSVQGTAAAALQIISPNEFRGQLVGLLIIVINGLGLGLGPAFVGAVTDFFFRDEARLGVSLSLLFAILGPIAALSLTLGLRSMREAVRIAESWRTGDEGVESTPHALAGANIRA